MNSCNQEKHDKCENSFLCHLCDGQRLYKNQIEKKQEAVKMREQRKQEEKNATLRIYKEEKKEGMALEKEVVKKWNAAYQKSQKEDVLLKEPSKKVKIQKPRIQIEEEKNEFSKEIEEVFPAVSLSSFSESSMSKNCHISDAKRQINSGALWYAKGDVKTDDYLMECKERGTVNGKGEKTISIPKEWLTKQEKEAFQENRHFWILPFRYKNDNTIYVVKTFDQEIEMYQELKRLREEIKNRDQRL